MTAVTSDQALEQVREVVAAVTDPEIPVLTLADLGVLRAVELDGDGAQARVVVTITPTYSGCPAMDEIRADIVQALAARGWPDVTVRTVLSPAWTTDWMSESGRRTLREFGIAPPAPRAGGPVPVELGRRQPAGTPAAAPVPPSVDCPQCGSADAEELARFASTACKALWRCRACREPFDHFKAH